MNWYEGWGILIVLALGFWVLISRPYDRGYVDGVLYERWRRRKELGEPDADGDQDKETGRG